MARTLTTGLQSGLRRGLQVGLGGGDFFTTASLDLNFARYKTLDPRVTFTRASSGTYVGSDGLIKTATTNLLLRSEEFDNASWTKGNASIITNSIAAPNGTLTGAKVVEDTANATHSARRSTSQTINTSPITFSVYVKAAERTYAGLAIQEATTFTRQANVNFDLANGTASAVSNIGGASASSTTITAVGNGWYRCTLTTTLGGTDTSVLSWIYISTSSGFAYAGNGTSGIYIWGAQLEQSSTVGEYISTTSTTNSAPRFDHAITSSVTNLLLRSEDFSIGVVWPLSGSTLPTITANAGISPDGNATADLWTRTITGSSFISQAITKAATTIQYTFSIFVKQSVGNFCALRIQGAFPARADVVFNIATGAISNAAAAFGGFTGASASIIPYPNNWYRLTFTATSDTATFTQCIASFNSNNAVIDGIDSASNSAGFLWGAQLEQSANVGTYVPTTTAAATSNTTESLGLLVEEQRTNYIRNNTMVGAAAGTPGTLPTNWVGTTTLQGLSREIVATGSSNGITYIRIKVSGTTTNTNTFFNVSTFDTLSASAGQSWATSTYCRLHSGSISTGILRVEFGRFNPTYAGGSTFNIVPTSANLNEQRFSTMFTPNDVGLTAINFGVQFFVAASGVAVDFTIDVGMPQLEQGAFATSVIPTTTAAATRSADVASITGTNFSSWYRQDEGTVFAESRVQDFTVTNFSRIASLDRGDASTNFAAIVRSSALNRVEYSAFAGTGQAVALQPAITFAGGSTLRSAFVYKTDDFIAAANGTLSPADTSGTMLTAVTTLGVGMQGNGGLPYNGTIRRLTYWPQRLANSTLQAITL